MMHMKCFGHLQMLCKCFRPFRLRKSQVSGEMIKVFKIMHGMEEVNRDSTFFSLPHTTRIQWGHPVKPNDGKFRTDKRKYFFTQLTVELWNSLPQDVVMVSNLDTFKVGLDKPMEDKAMNDN